MGEGLYDSVPTCDGKWRVALLDSSGKCRQLLPCVCESKNEAREFARTYLKLYSH